MAGLRMPPSTTPSKMKRALPEDAAAATHSTGKKRKVHHHLHHKQPRAEDVKDLIDDPTGQNGGVIQQQLLRAISTELKAVGFDGATPTAMESIRAQTETFMLHFLGNVKMSMSAGRRVQPVPEDFIHAMAARGLTSSKLEQHLDTQPFVPDQLLPELPPPPPSEEPPPALDDLLGPELSGKPIKETKKWIPKHLPAFPSKHAWQATPVYTNREQDPRKIREKATEEGILAEQALRKLMTANKAGIEKQGTSKRRQSKRQEVTEKLWKAAMKSVQAQEEEEKQQMLEKMREAELATQKKRDDVELNRIMGQETKMTAEEEAELLRRPPIKPGEKPEVESTGVMHINFERKYWRNAAQKAGA